MIALKNNRRLGNRSAPSQKAFASLHRHDNQRIATRAVTLPSVGGAYSYLAGRIRLEAPADDRGPSA